MRKLLFIPLTLLFFSCDDSASSDNSSTTYSLVSALGYDNPPDCNENEYDMTEWYLSGMGGTLQITMNKLFPIVKEK